MRSHQQGFGGSPFEIEALCIPIPFVFYRYGHKIREKSTLIRRMRENKERMEKKRTRAEQKIRQRAEVEAYEGPPMVRNMQGFQLSRTNADSIT